MSELKDLVGKMMLDAVDYDTEQVAKWEGEEELEDCQSMRFRLNGVVYAAIEDPNDGYRSSMRKLKVMKGADMKNVFDPVEVVGVYRSNRGWNDCDILELVSVFDGKTIIEVGTDNSDDYYPSFVSSFRPENIPPKP